MNTVARAGLIVGASAFVVLGLLGCTPAPDGERGEAIDATPAVTASDAPQVEIEDFDLGPYASVRAQLDEADETVVLPLSRYYMSARERLMVEHANDLIVDACMAEAGLSYPDADLPWDIDPVDFDRRYGLWSVTRAAAWGYELPKSARDIAAGERSTAATASQAWQDALGACAQSTTRLQILHPSGIRDEDSSFMAVVDAGSDAGDAYAARSPGYMTYRQALSDCLADVGLTIGESGAAWGPDIPDDAEEQITVAVMDATCHQQTGIVQGLSDLRARYESAFIAAHESELAAAKAKKEAIVQEARDVIARHAG